MFWTEVIDRRTGVVVSTSEFLADYESAKSTARGHGKSAYMAGHDAHFCSITDKVRMHGLHLEKNKIGFERELDRSKSLPKAALLFIQWLDADEVHEAKAIADEFSSRTDVAFVSAGNGGHGKNVVHAAILEWAANNPDRQFLYLSTHGNQTGVGTKKGPLVTWGELWQWLKEAEMDHIEFWIGACEGSSAVTAWNPLLAAEGKPPVGSIIAFPKSPTTSDLRKFITAIMKDVTAMNMITVKRAVEIAAETVPHLTSEAFEIGVDGGETAYVKIS